MYSVEDILARLQKGESQEDIVKEFTDAMNKASTEKAKKDQEAAAKLKKDAARKQAGEELMAAIHNYLEVAHPDLAAEVKYDATATNDYLDLLDNSLKSIVALKSIDWDKVMGDPFEMFFGTPKIEKPVKKSADDVLNAWLKKI
jgi:hypothetical protein